MSRAVTLVRPPSQSERIAALEKRAEAHDKMAEQFAEIYEAWGKLKTINWFVVKVLAWIGGGLGFVAVVLTIASNAAKLAGH